jgi:hypothetical protein
MVAGRPSGAWNPTIIVGRPVFLTHKVIGGCVSHHITFALHFAPRVRNCSHVNIREQYLTRPDVGAAGRARATSSLSAASVFDRSSTNSMVRFAITTATTDAEIRAARGAHEAIFEDGEIKAFNLKLSTARGTSSHDV